MKTERFFLMVTAAAAASLGLPGTADAIGCNGVVNPTIAGCARTDENDGAAYPYFRARRVIIPTSSARIEMKSGAPLVQHQGRWLPVISASGGNLIAVADGN